MFSKQLKSIVYFPILLLLCFITALQAYAQTGNVSGKVTDSKGNPLAMPL